MCETIVIRLMTMVRPNIDFGGGGGGSGGGWCGGSYTIRFLTERG